jgi:arginine exporter protein ArgO
VPNFFRYLHYRLYAWGLATWGEKDMPQWNALIGVTFLMLANLSLIGLAFHFAGFPVFLREKTPRLEILLIAGAVFLVNYFLMLHKEQYLKTAKKYADEPEKLRTRHAFLLWIYALTSIALPFCVGFLYYQLTK